MAKILTRRQAQDLGLSRYLGLPCKNGHEGWRFKTGHCVTCCAERRDAPDRREAAKVRASEWYQNNKRRAAETMRRYRAANPGYDRAAKKKWKTSNPEAVRAATAERRAKRISATPRWLTKEQRRQTVEIYRTCPVGYEVDHAIPLVHPKVCGLHVPWNLRHLSVEENRRKSNKLDQALGLSPSGLQDGSQ